MTGLIDLFMPREKKFFEYLEKKTALLKRCAGMLTQTSLGMQVDLKALKKGHIFLEAASDQEREISQDIVRSLHETFITPIDRGEIQALSTSIDRLVDSIEKIFATLVYFHIRHLDTFFARQQNILVLSISDTVALFKHPLDRKKNSPYITRIGEYERKADQTYRQAMTALFEDNHPPLAIMKRKELYESVEEAIDEVKVIADYIESILINHA